jgi:hypothetical protein
MFVAGVSVVPSEIFGARLSQPQRAAAGSPLKIPAAGLHFLCCG